MNKYALVKNNKVVNTLQATENYLPYIQSQYEEIVQITKDNPLGIGWYKENDEWKKPETLHPNIEKITRRQGLLAIYEQKGITEDNILQIIESLPTEEQKYKANIEFHAATWEINSPMIGLFAQNLSINQEELQSLFNYAGTL